MPLMSTMVQVGPLSHSVSAGSHLRPEPFELLLRQELHSIEGTPAVVVVL
jgi:hypothetical protein